MSNGVVIIPIQPVGSQTLQVTLGNQYCTLNIYEKDVVQTDNVLVNQNGQPLVNTAGQQLVQGIAQNATPAALYLDLYVSGLLIVGGIFCQNGVKIVRTSYLGFVGDLVFYDTAGSNAPLSSGLGTRWILTYQPNLA